MLPSSVFLSVLNVALVTSALSRDHVSKVTDFYLLPDGVEIAGTELPEETIVAKGDIEFILDWDFRDSMDAEGPDIDLWVIDPAEEIITSSRTGYGLGPTPKYGGVIDVDDMGGTGNGDGRGPERAYWPAGSAPVGKYFYGVRYYGGTGIANARMRVRIAGVVVETKQIQLTQKGNAIPLGVYEYSIDPTVKP